MIRFTKMNGAGNDFIVMDNRDGVRQFTGEQIARLCDRHRGVGADGMLLVEPAQNGGDARMRYYNADGGEAEMCGNGARCFARFAKRLLGDKITRVSFETIAGLIQAEFPGDPRQVRIQLSKPHGLALGASLHVDGQSMEIHFVNTGVPHAVVLSEALEAVELRRFGSAIRYHDHFAPKGTNANFQQVLGPGKLRIRTYERGVEDETLACGTGIVANAIIHHELSGAPAPISVEVAGGDTLTVDFEKSGDDYANVTLTGPADFVFEGTLESLPD